MCVLISFFTADQNSCGCRLWHCSLLFLPLEDVLFVLFWLHYREKITRKVYLLLENLNISSNLNADFVPGLILLIDICSSWLLFWNLISIVPIALYCLELTKLLLEHAGVLFEYFNRTAIYAFPVPAKLVLLASLDLNLNESESVMLSLEPFWRHCHRLSDISK